jgi:outer membrane protein W
MKKAIYIFILSVGFSGLVKAQEMESTSTSGSLPTDMFFVGYEVAIPTTTDYLSETSWAGFRIDYRHMVTPNVSVGIAMSFNTFDEYFSKQTYQRADGSGAITSDMIRQIYTTPITATVHYYFNGSKIRPYVGLGLGTQYSEQNAYFNIYAVGVNNWGFVARPEAGILGKFNENLSGYVSVAYNYGTNQNDTFNVDNISYVPITIGLVFNP